MTKSTATDAMVFIALIALGSAFPWFVRGTIWENPMIWSLVVTIPVAVYLGFRRRKNWRKIFIGSFVFGGLFGAILEFVAHVTLAWQVPHTIFPLRILGASTIEALIGYIPMTLLVLVFYEHFFDTDRNHHVSPHVWRAIIPGLLVAVFIVWLYLFNPGRLSISHPYVKMGLVAIIPLVVQVIRNPRLFAKFAQLAFSLFFVLLTFEIIGVSFKFWIYPGASGYLGIVNMLGVTFPIEEIIFWALLYPATIAAYYEEFIQRNTSVFYTEQLVRSSM